MVWLHNSMTEIQHHDNRRLKELRMIRILSWVIPDSTNNPVNCGAGDTDDVKPSHAAWNDLSLMTVEKDEQTYSFKKHVWDLAKVLLLWQSLYIHAIPQYLSCTSKWDAQVTPYMYGMQNKPCGIIFYCWGKEREVVYCCSIDFTIDTWWECFGLSLDEESLDEMLSNPCPGQVTE